jgi:hypothetical protein
MNSQNNLWKPILITMWVAVFLCGLVLNARAEYPQMVCSGDQCVITPIGERPPSYDGEIYPSYDVVTPPTQSQVIEVIKKKVAIELGWSYADSASVVKQLRVGALTEYSKGPLLITANLKSWFTDHSATVARQDARSGNIEFDWYTSEHRYNGLYIAAAQDKPLGERYTVSDTILTGYDLGNGMFVDTGITFTRQVRVVGEDYAVIDWEPSIYLGGTVSVAGVGLNFDVDLGQNRQAGKATVSYTEPLADGVSLKITDDIRYDNPPIGANPVTSIMGTSVAFSY